MSSPVFGARVISRQLCDHDRVIDRMSEAVEQDIEVHPSFVFAAVRAQQSCAIREPVVVNDPVAALKKVRPSSVRLRFARRTRAGIEAASFYRSFHA